jgi:hypothetical protein
MHEYSIRFTDAEVRAVLAGTKTQATWVIKMHSSYRHPLAERARWQPGDRLRVRECWMAKNWSDKECAKAGCPDAAVHPSETMYGFRTRAIYRASYNESIGSPGAWKSSTQMPRWASRINLLVKITRVEKLTGAWIGVIEFAVAAAKGLGE